MPVVSQTVMPRTPSSAKRLAQVSAQWQLGDQQSRTLGVDRLPTGCALSPAGCRVGPDSFRYFIETL